MLASQKHWSFYVNTPQKRLAVFLLLSLLFHLFFLRTKYITWNSFDKEHGPEVNKIEFLDPQLAQEMLNRVKQQENLDKKQIVNNTNTGEEIKPKDSRFLGEKDQTFDRQTKARKLDIFNKGGQGLVQTPSQENVRPVEEKKASKIDPNKIKLSDLAITDMGNLQVAPKNEPTEVARPAVSAKQGMKNNQSDGVGIAANNDFVEDIPLGDTTNLNTTEFKYYGFYVRIRQRLEQHWGNTLREKAKAFYSSGRRIPANENFITSIKLVINSRGEIVDVIILGKSGVRELDEAAIESFNKAGPFPNPPPGLLKDGRAEIEWGFVVKS